MGTRTNPGFTIIETVLFLSVTGLLVLGVMVGVGASLNNQRYTDAVESFKNLVQQQYADLGSVRNGRTNDWNCSDTAMSTQDGSTRRGQSDCIIVGKYMRIDKGDITIYTVLARQTSTVQRATDIATLRNNYTFNESTSETESQDMEWGTYVAWPVHGSGSRPVGTNRQMGILFLRSPETGNIYTFTSDTIPPKDIISDSTFKPLIVSGGGIPGQSQRHICVSGSGLFAGGDMAIFLRDYAAGSSAVEVRSDDTSIALTGDGGSRCRP